MSPDTLLILIAPNVSQQMGGEAIKALQIFQELSRLHANTVQITHSRNREEVSRLGLKNIRFIDDDLTGLLLFHSRILRPWLDVWFAWKAVRLADALADGTVIPLTIILQTEPNSPVLPRVLSKHQINAFGPINGNIYFPNAFRERERLSVSLRRIFHMPLQRLNRFLPGGLRKADQILVAGGYRTRHSLRTAGCSEQILRDSLDCGIPDALLDRPRVNHAGINLSFLHFGRLVMHKGTWLILKSLPKTRNQINLDIVGRGPELSACKALVEKLGLSSRVRFLNWYTAHDDLLTSFSHYRGVVLPSIEDANGIVIQEAMALGLPPVCLDWGGPSLPINHGINGFLIKPDSIDQITTELAGAMDVLAEDGDLAECMSRSARQTAEHWRWSVVANEWLTGLPTARLSA